MVAKKLSPVGNVTPGGKNIDDVTPDPKSTPMKVNVITLVLDISQLTDELILLAAFTGLERDCHRRVIIGRANTINTADTGDDNRIPSSQQCRRGGVAQAVNLIINLTILFDIGVAAGHVGFRLVIVKVADEIVDFAVWKKGFELAIKLCRQRLIVCHDERRDLTILDNVGHRKRLTTPGHSQQSLFADTAMKALK